MNSLVKVAATLILGISAVGITQASAAATSSAAADDRRGDHYDDRHYDRRDGRYDRRHDRRDRRYDRRGRYDRGEYKRGRYHDYRHYRGYPRSRLINRRHIDTRHRAYITVVEEVYYTRSGREQLVCSVLVRGPEAYYVPQRRLRRAANRHCSRYARIQYL